MTVSIVVPVYNAREFLDKSVGCVLSQTHRDLELILVDDGSTDGSEVICGKYVASDARVKFVSQKNGGPAAARNTGVKHATGDFALFLDADDQLELDILEVMLAYYERYKTDLVMSNFAKLENDGKLVKQKVTFRHGEEPFEGDFKILEASDVDGYVRHFHDFVEKSR